MLIQNLQDATKLKSLLNKILGFELENKIVGTSQFTIILRLYTWVYQVKKEGMRFVFLSCFHN